MREGEKNKTFWKFLSNRERGGLPNPTPSPSDHVIIITVVGPVVGPVVGLVVGLDKPEISLVEVSTQL